MEGQTVRTDLERNEINEQSLVGDNLGDGRIQRDDGSGYLRIRIGSSV